VNGFWWQKAVIYQVYPRSFQDSNADGVGDLKGIIERLPYLIDLGVDAIWLSPIFPSPMADFGYDVSDYTDIDPLFGSLADFDRLLEIAHSSGLKIILDFVPNHTSDRHPWFMESRSSRQNDKRDWYLWRDSAPEGGPPNNWLSEFGGSAWQYDKNTRQYYYHAFLAAQPDLNWRNASGRNAIYDAMRFWLRRGVDGFRLDVIWHLIKDDLFRDNPLNPQFTPNSQPSHAVIPLYTADRPEIQQIIAELRCVAEEFGDRLLIGEIYLPLEKLVKYYGTDVSGLHLPFNFSLLNTSWDASALAKLITDYEKALPPHGWPNWVLGNHDKVRIASRVAKGCERLAAMLLLTLRGTPTIYYGDEIGMEQAVIAPDKICDPVDHTMPGLGLGRDGCRTPMQWSPDSCSGFSTVKPWLPLQERWPENNVQLQTADERSLLHLYRGLIALRRRSTPLVDGSYRFLFAQKDILAFARVMNDERLLVTINFGNAPTAIEIGPGWEHSKLVLSSYLDRSDELISSRIDLRPLEGLIFELPSTD
jgi:alpha-glucosidase